jgi:hypothetical protein
MGIKEVKKMAKKRFVIFQEQIREFSRKGWKSKLIGMKGGIILLEAEVPEEELANERPIIMEDRVNEPWEC